MIPAGDFADPALLAGLIHPWTASRTEAYQLGPEFIQVPGPGLLVKMWLARAEGNQVLVSSDTTPEFVAFTHTEVITDLSLAFDQNANLTLSFMDRQGASYYYWWDPLIPGYNTTLLSGFSPRVTLDDGRDFNTAASDVVLGYVGGGNLRYRLQRDRFSVEYTPISDATGLPIPAQMLYHLSMSTDLRVVFLYGDYLSTGLQYASKFLRPLIMKKQVVKQKAPVEELPLTFDFSHTMVFGDTIVSAAVNITVEVGTDLDTSGMKVGDPTHTDTTVTQIVTGGITGQVYRVSMSVGTANNCIYVTEGLLYVNDSPAILPPSP